MDQLVPTAALTTLPFTKACEAWLESRKPYLAEKTHHEYRLNIKTLSSFFGQFRLQEIDGDLLRAYQRARKLKCGAFAINHECGLVCLIRKRIGLPIDDYQPLPLPKEKTGRVPTDEERVRLLRIGSENPEWEAAYLFAKISANTTAGPKEVASLRLKDVFEDREEIVIPPHGAKNITRARPIPLNHEALDAIRQAMKRGKRLGSVEPQHFIFPRRTKRGNRHSGADHYDPTRPQTSFKSAWKSMTKAALLGNLQMYDLRRYAITAMLENSEISDETVQEIAGHRPGSRVTKRYSYIRSHARRAAVEALAPKKAAIKEKTQKKTAAISTEREQLVSDLSRLLAKLLKTA
jgi:integrase